MLINPARVDKMGLESSGSCPHLPHIASNTHCISGFCITLMLYITGLANTCPNPVTVYYCRATLYMRTAFSRLLAFFNNCIGVFVSGQ